jgi:hypothetical protein
MDSSGQKGSGSHSRCPLASALLALLALLGCYGAEMALSSSVRVSLKLNGRGPWDQSPTENLWESTTAYESAGKVL